MKKSLKSFAAVGGECEDTKKGGVMLCGVVDVRAWSRPVNKALVAFGDNTLGQVPLSSVHFQEEHMDDSPLALKKTSLGHVSLHLLGTLLRSENYDQLMQEFRSGTMTSERAGEWIRQLELEKLHAADDPDSGTDARTGTDTNTGTGNTHMKRQLSPFVQEACALIESLPSPEVFLTETIYG
jgi:hypothetical protein